MKIFQPRSLREASEILMDTGTTTTGVEIMRTKSIGLAVDIGDVSSSLGNILKQESLAVGADAAVHELVSRCDVPKTKVVLVGTLKQLQKLAIKLQKNIVQLSEIGKNLEIALAVKFLP